MRYAAGMAWRRSTRKSRHREIETAPEKMHRARLAEEGGAELLQHPIGIDENLEKATHGVGIVRGVPVVLRKPSRLRQFVRHLVDRDVNAELCEVGHDGPIKACDRMSGQGKLARGAVAGRNTQTVIDQVKVDLKAIETVRYWGGRQPARGDVERDMPGMIEPRRARQANLADDLGPQVQRRIGLAPCRGRQFRPCKNFSHGEALRLHQKTCGRRSPIRTPPTSYQPCSFFAVSAITCP